MQHLRQGPTRTIPYLLLCLCFLLVISLSPKAEEQPISKKRPEQFSATAFGQAGMFAGKNAALNIYISSYSSDQEIQDLAKTLQSKGSPGLLKVVQKMKQKGRVSTVGRTGWNVSVVRQRVTEKGRRIVLFSDRPISFYEAREAPRSKNYEFGMLVLDVNDKGEGSGVLYGACKIKFNKDNQIDVEHYGIAPARLAAVKLWQ